jgi:hypothetical protein
MTTAASKEYSGIKVTWEVVITNHKTNEETTRKIVTYYRPKIEKEDAALEAIRYQLAKNEGLVMVLSKEKQPMPMV